MAAGRRPSPATATSGPDGRDLDALDRVTDTRPASARRRRHRRRAAGRPGRSPRAAPTRARRRVRSRPLSSSPSAFPNSAFVYANDPIARCSRTTMSKAGTVASCACMPSQSALPPGRRTRSESGRDARGSDRVEAEVRPGAAGQLEHGSRAARRASRPRRRSAGCSRAGPRRARSRRCVACRTSAGAAPPACRSCRRRAPPPSR